MWYEVIDGDICQIDPVENRLEKITNKLNQRIREKNDDMVTIDVQDVYFLLNIITDFKEKIASK